MQKIELQQGKKIYFASDFHLGAHGVQSSAERELAICSWLDSIKHNAQQVFFLGDMFDFWYEYKTVVPKGFLRLFGKIIELQNTGVTFTFFTGNHDLWLFNYFSQELNISIHHKPQSYQLGSKSFHLGHGDGLGPGDYVYKFLKKIFTNPLAQWLFGWLHPDVGISLATYWSRSRKTEKRLHHAAAFVSADKELIYQYCLQTEQTQPHHYYVFGHRHLALNLALTPTAQYYNLGEWFISGRKTYAVFDGQQLELQEFKG
jgi:UDP-2,3-diacylglucosamine hydrolase